MSNIPTSAASQSAEGVPALSATDEQQHRTSTDGEGARSLKLPTREWLTRKIAEDPDLDAEAGRPLNLPTDDA